MHKNFLVSSITAIAVMGSVLAGRELAAGHELRQCLDILRHIETVHLDDGKGNKLKTLRVTGVNVQIVNGMGATNGYRPDPWTNDGSLVATNGLGNLIVGYNEMATTDLEHLPLAGNDRSGSHNLIVGNSNTYLSFGGIVAGQANSNIAPYSSITAGKYNVTSGLYAGVSGGGANRAEGEFSSCSGGSFNAATGKSSSVQGGTQNSASGVQSAVSGGNFNTASGQISSVGGGDKNLASGNGACVVGGDSNIASGKGSAVSGGFLNEAIGEMATVGGGTSVVVSDPNAWGAGSLLEGGAD